MPKKKIKKISEPKRCWCKLSVNKYTVSGALLLAAIGGGYASQYFFGPDNVIEEAAEKFIEKNTGWSVDLSPQTPEFLMKRGT